MNKILEAIKNKNQISFNYQNKKRIGNPHMVGEIKNKTYLLFWQTSGESSKNDLPQWRTFLLNDITDIKIIEIKFKINEDCFKKDFDRIIKSV